MTKFIDARKKWVEIEFVPECWENWFICDECLKAMDDELDESLEELLKEEEEQKRDIEFLYGAVENLAKLQTEFMESAVKMKNELYERMNLLAKANWVEFKVVPEVPATPAHTELVKAKKRK